MTVDRLVRTNWVQWGPARGGWHGMAGHWGMGDGPLEQHRWRHPPVCTCSASCSLGDSMSSCPRVCFARLQVVLRKLLCSFSVPVFCFVSRLVFSSLFDMVFVGAEAPLLPLSHVSGNDPPVDAAVGCKAARLRYARLAYWLRRVRRAGRVL